MIQLDSLGKRIAYLRTKNSLTQKELMKLLNFDNLSRYENDERKPSLNIIISLAKHFNVSTDWLLLGEGIIDATDWLLLGENRNGYFYKGKILSTEEQKCIYLFSQLSDLGKGIIIGRMEEMIENNRE